ncbi:MAG: class I SAM-dependent methyltransferase [Sulfuriferula sp.]
MGIATEICFWLSRNRVLNRREGDAGENPATFTSSTYQAWRTSELCNQFAQNFDATDIAGMDVLDFGCGEGDLSFYVGDLGVHSITGVDVNAERVDSAKSRLQTRQVAVTPKFLCASNTHAIDLPDESVDIILCFDVLEHILDYESIIPEWRRVLRKNGKVFIWWVPWFHPHGHHIESLVPLPWAHAVFSDKALITTCARIYDMPEFRPRLWDLDVEGNKKPNKWLTMERLPDVNRLTITRFERLCRKIGLDIAERRPKGFGGSSLAKVTHLFTRIPLLREFFCAHVVYKLHKHSDGND